MRYPYKDRPYYIHKTHAALVTATEAPRGRGTSGLGAARTALLNYTGGGARVQSL